MMSDDRPKKSWREIDRQRESSSRREPRSEGQRSDPRRQRSYRAQLDRLFGSGKIGALVEQQAGPSGDDQPGDNRIKAMAKINAAEGRADVTKAIDAYLKCYEELPGDFDVLTKALEHRNPTLQLDAMERMGEVIAEEPPRRSRAAIGQLKLVRDTSDEPEMVALARELIDRLE